MFVGLFRCLVFLLSSSEMHNYVILSMTATIVTMRAAMEQKKYHISQRSTVEMHREQLADDHMQEHERPVGELSPSRRSQQRLAVSPGANEQFLANSGLFHQQAFASESTVPQEQCQNQMVQASLS